MKIRYIQRTADRQGFRMCAMTAISFNLGYQPLTDTPKEVDPGLAAFVCLLNDRANDKARSLLIPRLGKIPHTGRTDLAHLIAKVFLPAAMGRYGYAGEAETIWGDTPRQSDRYSHRRSSALVSIFDTAVEPLCTGPCPVDE